MGLTGIPELRNAYRAIGGFRFILMIVGTLVWLAIEVWLATALDYPRAFGSSCHRKCAIEHYWYSGALLQRGGLAAYALFAMLWSIPAAVGAALICRAFKRDPLSTKIISE